VRTIAVIPTEIHLVQPDSQSEFFGASLCKKSGGYFLTKPFVELLGHVNQLKPKSHSSLERSGATDALYLGSIETLRFLCAPAGG
jgi:hypothetical protein